MILRLEVGGDGKTRAWLYNDDGLAKEFVGQNMAEVAMMLEKFIKKNWRQVEGIYVFLGPAGYSRLRATHAFALGIGLAQHIPVAGYKNWRDRLGMTIPHQSQTRLKPIYP